ncbi:MAG TPA: helix-turn-helix transcriptional regulator [Bacillus sp. (in: firmicutes)]|nr:helix-turn-helix transcriptional regulator [Bacillus sp. (in: firmicutes)]
MFRLGKKRSKLGEWLDKRGISQQWLSKSSKVSRTTVSDLCKGESEHAPTQSTMKKILKALRNVDPNVKADDFWDM